MYMAHMCTHVYDTTYTGIARVIRLAEETFGRNVAFLSILPILQYNLAPSLPPCKMGDYPQGCHK